MSHQSRNRHSRQARIVALLATFVVLWLVGPVGLAQANNPTDAQYDNSVTKVGGEIGGGSATSPTAAPSGLQKKVVGGLPFTGLDMVALTVVSVALLSMGLGLRRLTADRYL
jgi:uncharacterized membrane protein